AGQTTEFTYQGQLQSSSTPANGSFDFEFALFDAVGGGSQIGSTLTRSGVTVANGIFSVSLDFGSGFPGAGRFLEIRVRQTGGGGFTMLSPRQAVTSSPYAIKSITSDSATVATNAITANNATTANNALQLGGVAANQFVVTTDPRMTNDRPPTPGSSNYIQNSTAAQAASNFNITGNGTAGGTLSAGIVNATTQFNIGGERVLSNLLVSGNLFVGRNSGINTVPTLVSGVHNSFVGLNSGFNNTSGQSNSFFGYGSGSENTTGSSNTFVGYSSVSISNTTGSNNTLLGSNATVGSANLSYATAIGSDAVVSLSNSVVLGRTNDTVRVPGILSVTGGTDVEPGFGGYIVAGTITGTNVTIDDNEIMARDGGATNTLFINADGGDVNLISTGTGNVGIGVGGTPLDKLHVDGIIRVSTLGAAGGTSLCRNASQQISTCSSSLRYKTNINRFGLGLSLINQLKPITFDWKDGGMNDLGLGAEDVAAIEPLLVTYNTKGEVEGVKYDRIGVVLVNAVKEQQAQIEVQRRIIEKLEQRLTELERKQQEQARKP
ncbi:MAG: tail fiber domain-containing protein, partial [Pyrinomonadaceae bacterium]